MSINGTSITGWNRTASAAPSAPLGGSYGHLNASLQANEIYTVAERSLSWFSSKWQNIQNWWYADSLKQAAKEQRVSAIKSQQADAKFKEEFMHLLEAAQQNWSEEAKQQIVQVIQERIRLTKKRAVVNWIEGQVHVTLRRHFKEIMQAVENVGKRVIQQTAPSPTYSSEVSEPGNLFPSSNSMSYPTLCVSNGQGLAIGWNEIGQNYVPALQLFSVQGNSLTLLTNVSAALQGPVQSLNLTMGGGGSVNPFLISCNSGHYSVITSIYSNEQLFYYAFSINNGTFSPTPYLLQTLHLYGQLVQLPNGSCLSLFENLFPGEISQFLCTNASGNFNPSDSLAINLPNQTSQAALSYSDGSMDIFATNANGTMVTAVNTSGSPGVATPLVDETIGDYPFYPVALPKTPIPTNQNYVSFVGYAEAPDTPYYICTYDRINKIFGSCYVPPVNSEYPTIDIANCAPQDPDLFVITGISDTTYIWYDLVRASLNSSSVIGGLQILTVTTDRWNPVVGCSNGTAVITYVNGVIGGYITISFTPISSTTQPSPQVSLPAPSPLSTPSSAFSSTPLNGIFSPNASQPTTSGPTSTSIPIVPIAGGVVGGAAGIGIVAFAIVCVVRRRKKRRLEGNERANMELGLGNESALFISKADIKLGIKIAEGTFGDVFIGTYFNEQVAIKQLKGELTRLKKEKLLKEVKVMSELHSGYVVHFYGVTKEEPNWIVMQFCEGGSLKNFLGVDREKINQKEIPWKRRLKLAHDVSQGLALLHRKGIVHGDLKSPNILLNKTQDQALLTDFGLATMEKERSEQLQSSPIAGSLRWMAPELLTGSESSTASDIYALGMVLFEFVARQLPFKNTGWENRDIIKKVKQGARETFPNGTPNKYVELAKRCWDGVPENRPSAEEAAQVLTQLCQEESILFGTTGQSALLSSPSRSTYMTQTYEATSTMDTKTQLGIY